jgi:hypothetical protein
MAERDEHSEHAAVRKALAELVTGGVMPYNVAAHGGVLLEFEIVISRLELTDDDANEDDDKREEDYAAALVSVLGEAVVKARIPQRAYRRVLKCVLPLRDEYLGLAIKDRRIVAAQELKTPKKTIKPATVRTYYEPRALDALATVLLEMEASYLETKRHEGADPDSK